MPAPLPILSGIFPSAETHPQSPHPEVSRLGLPTSNSPMIATGPPNLMEETPQGPFHFLGLRGQKGHLSTDWAPPSSVSTSAPCRGEACWEWREEDEGGLEP